MDFVFVVIFTFSLLVTTHTIVETTSFNNASAEEVMACINGESQNVVLVDARPQEAYSGWVLQGAKNGGHFENAVLYSARWLDFATNAERREKRVNSYNEAIALSKDKTYIVYDYAGEKNAAVSAANYLKSQNIETVKVFDAKELIDEGKYLVSYLNYDRYLPSEVVKDLSDYITGKDDSLEELTSSIFTADDLAKIRIFDISYGNVHESNYLSEGHVPGAVHISTNTYERLRSYTPEKREKYSVEYSLVPIEEFRDSILPEYGVNKDSIVIGISNDTRPIARFGFMLRSLGVRYYGMSGLMNAWNYNGFPVDTKNVEKPVSIESFGSGDIPHPEEIVWMDEVKAMLAANEEDENNHTAGTLIGGDKIDSTYDYHDLMGRIQGAKNASGGIFENPDGTPAMKELMVKFYNDNDIPMDKPIVHFCGDGWGASKEAYNAQSVGLENVKYWDEGWVVWSNCGNWFIDHEGRKVRFDIYLDEVVDEEGNIVSDGVNRKAK